MKFLHTADWHLGQQFFDYDRSYEHQQFLDWLLLTLQSQQIDVLLIAGDVFDGANPANHFVKQLYAFLANAKKVLPHLQIIIIAGNHDSALGLERPNPFLAMTGITIVGAITKTNGKVDADKLLIPIYNQQQQIETWCMAIPFLRLGDYPSIGKPYIDGVVEMYQHMYAHALQQKQAGQSIIAMGHMHTAGARVDDSNKQERPIMGNQECVPAYAFDAGITYTALGHIHKAQKVNQQTNIRYSGSVLPMSFSEINYAHKVIVFEIENEQLNKLQEIEIPKSVELIRVPLKHSLLADVLMALQELPAADASNMHQAPYLEVQLLIDNPEPTARKQIQDAVQNKHVKFASIKSKHANPNVVKETEVLKDLQEVSPEEIFTRAYFQEHNTDVPSEILDLFRHVLLEVNTQEL
jgi:DNA repair protein SbcD/Mre11